MYVTVTIRVHKDVKESWVNQARESGLTLGKFIQQRMGKTDIPSDGETVEPFDRKTLVAPLKNVQDMPKAPQIPNVPGVVKAKEIKRAKHRTNCMCGICILERKAARHSSEEVSE